MGRLSDLLSPGGRPRCWGRCRKCRKRCMFDKDHSGSCRCKGSH